MTGRRQQITHRMADRRIDVEVYVRTEGPVTVAQVAARFVVPPTTARRILSELTSIRMVQATPGPPVRYGSMS